MINILEIPVIHLLNDLERDFIRSIPVHSDRSYRGFRHIESKIDEDKSVYFYILEKHEDHFTQSVWDRIIPKAPFTVFLLEEKNHAALELIGQYKQKYSTPYYIFIPLNRSLGTVDEGSEESEEIFFYNPEKENGVLDALTEALKRFKDQAVSEQETAAP